MPVTSLADAAAAYSRIGSRPTAATPETRIEPKGPDFGSMVREAAEEAIQELRQSEGKTLQAAAGGADINQVVMAVAKADMTLQTVVAVRDRVIQAYQDVLRMPI